MWIILIDPNENSPTVSNRMILMANGHHRFVVSFIQEISVPINHLHNLQIEVYRPPLGIKYPLDQYSLIQSTKIGKRSDRIITELVYRVQNLSPSSPFLNVEIPRWIQRAIHISFILKNSLSIWEYSLFHQQSKWCIIEKRFLKMHLRAVK